MLYICYIVRTYFAKQIQYVFVYKDICIVSTEIISLYASIKRDIVNILYLAIIIISIRDDFDLKHSN